MNFIIIEKVKIFQKQSKTSYTSLQDDITKKNKKNYGVDKKHIQSKVTFKGFLGKYS